MPRGGPRRGRQSQSYSNRKDLNQPVRTAPGQVYGAAGQQAQAQQAIPLPAQSPPPGPSGPPAAGGAPAPSPSGAALGGGVSPGDLGALHAPSQRPNEPLTAGLPTGPGPGPEAVGLAGPGDDTTLATLKGLLARYPNNDLRALVAQASQPR